METNSPLHSQHVEGAYGSVQPKLIRRPPADDGMELVGKVGVVLAVAAAATVVLGALSGRLSAATQLTASVLGGTGGALLVAHQVHRVHHHPEEELLRLGLLVPLSVVTAFSGYHALNISTGYSVLSVLTAV